MNQHYAAVNANLGACRAYAAGPGGEFVYWAGYGYRTPWFSALAWKSGVVFEGDWK